MKTSVGTAVIIIFFLSACGGGKRPETKNSGYDKGEIKVDESETQMTTVTVDVNPITQENLISQILAPIRLEKSYPASPYNVKAGEIDNITACSNFGVIDRNRLNSGGDLYWETVSRDDKNKIKLFKLASGDFDKNSKAFVFDYTNSLDTFCTNEGRVIKVKLVAGIRIVYTVKDWSLKVGIDGLEKIAASKELNFSQSSLHVSTIGWGQETTSILALKSAIQKISVKNYPEACQALLELMTAYGNTSQVRPEAIPIE